MYWTDGSFQGLCCGRLLVFFCLSIMFHSDTCFSISSILLLSLLEEEVGGRLDGWFGEGKATEKVDDDDEANNSTAARTRTTSLERGGHDLMNNGFDEESSSCGNERYLTTFYDFSSAVLR